MEKIDGVIWDMDGTLYRYDELFKTACNHAAARAAITVRPEYTYEYAFEQCVAAEKKSGFSLQWFHEETKMTFESMHFVYHNSIDEKVIQRNEDMANGLRSLTIPSVLLTNSSRGWVSRVTKHLGIDDIFTENNILALEDFNFQPKGRSTAGFEKAIDLLGLHPSRILLVEDLPRNLVRAKEAGLQTALVHHGQVPDDQSNCDYLFQDAIEVTNALKKAA